MNHTVFVSCIAVLLVMVAPHARGVPEAKDILCSPEVCPSCQISPIMAFSPQVAFTETSAVTDSANAVMSYTLYDTSRDTTTTYTVQVTVTQLSDSLITVNNFLGKGVSVEVKLRGSRRATIASQYVQTNSLGADEYIYAVDYNSDYTSVNYRSPIICDEACDARTISWGNWNMVFTYEESTYWSGTVYTGGKIETQFDLVYPEQDSIPIAGEGSAENPYRITSATEWNAFAGYLSAMYEPMMAKYVELTSDIDFTGVEIKALCDDDDMAFYGDFNGNGKTIKGINASVSEDYSGAVIASTGKTAYIHDFIVEGSVTSSASYSGGVVGTLLGELSNVVSNLSVTSTGEYCPGGVVGYAYGASITNCAYGGAMAASGAYSGGIAGFISYTTVSDCVNNGSVSSTGRYASGLVGYAYYYSGISQCVNNGTITGSQNYAAGIVGYSYYYPTLTSCFNRGTVAITKNGAVGASGVVAFAYASTITGCTNQGEVSSTGSYNGGVVAYADAYCTIADCVNDSSGSINGAGYIGGVAGYTSSYCSVTGCINRGEVSSTSTYTGGVIGYTTYSVISDCFNEGAVTSKSTYAAGVTGYSGLVCVYDNCGNKGTVTYTGSTAACYVAGVIARCCYGTFSGCYNEGVIDIKLSTATYVAGVFAELYSATSYTITDCYNTSDITCYNYAAGIIAQTNSSTRVVMEGCYNTGNITTTNTKTLVSYPTAGLMLYYTKGSSFTGCWNSGKITSGGANYTGGLFGCRKTSASETYPVTFSGCYNTGDVASSGNFVGGIIGYVYTNYTTFDNCYNTGNVTSSGYYTGGISGAIDAGNSTSVTQCWNSGVVSTAVAYAGGITGYNPSNDVISCCFNTGDITAPSDSATVGYAIGGIAGYSASDISDAYNTGSVSGVTCVAGIVGSPVSGQTTISSVYSTGSIYASDGGNIIGEVMDGVVSNAYFLDINSRNSTTDSYGTALSYAQLASIDMGSSWASSQEYTYPMLSGLDTVACAKAHAAVVIPADGDTYDGITGSFHVGIPVDVEWSASSSAVAIDGNTATFSEPYSGILTMTATCGDISVDTQLYCAVESGGIEGALTTERTVVGEEFYTISGSRVMRPDGCEKAIYVVIRTYDDGMSVATKEMR